MQTKLIGDLCCVHGVGQVLFVGENEQEGVPQLVLVEHTLKLFAGLRDTFAIVRIDDENDALGVLEIWEQSASRLCHVINDCKLTVPPQRSDLVLSSYVPNRERDVLVFYRLDIES